ncbi:MAG TPA: ABC transporter permease [Gemmata sp.]|nr:ABC transporter permease [Gemmata sp.]
MTPRASRPFIPWLLAAPAILLLLAFFLWPMLLLLRVSFFESPEAGVGFYRPDTWSTHAYIELLGERFGRGIIAFTIALGVSVAALSLLIGYPLALFIHYLPRRAKVLALGVVILPKLANVFIVLYGINLLLGNMGPVNRSLLLLGLTHEPLLLVHNLIGVVIAETYLILPYAVLVLVPTFDRIDPTLTAAARGLGASRVAAFLRVILPLSLPGVAVAGQLCLIWALGAFVGPVLLGGPEQTTLSVWVQRQGTEYSDWPRAAATAVLTVCTVAVCVVVYAWPSGWLRRIRGANRG